MIPRCLLSCRQSGDCNTIEMKMKTCLNNAWALKSLLKLIGLIFIILLGTHVHANQHYYFTDIKAASKISDSLPKGDMNTINIFERSRNKVARMRSLGQYTLMSCNNITIGERPVHQTDNLVGNECEPWMGRYSIMLLQELIIGLDINRALEYSTGSSSMWFLNNVEQLYSVEHDKIWADMTKQRLTSVFGEQFVNDHWSLHFVPQIKRKSLSYEEQFASYVNVALRISNGSKLDLISVDGRSRVECIAQAIGLLKSNGGILILDNSERPSYRSAFDIVPKHWLVFSDEQIRNPGKSKGSTHIWVSIPMAMGTPH